MIAFKYGCERTPFPAEESRILGGTEHNILGKCRASASTHIVQLNVLPVQKPWYVSMKTCRHLENERVISSWRIDKTSPFQKVSTQILRLCKIGRKLKLRERQSKQFQWFVSDHWVNPPSPRFWNPIFENPFIWNCFVCKICFYIFCWIRNTINRNLLHLSLSGINRAQKFISPSCKDQIILCCYHSPLCTMHRI